jgi:flagellin
MAVKINFNEAAVKTHTALIQNERVMGKSLLRLSTGYRILNAADDSAGLFIADMLGTVAAALDQGNANIQTGISALQIAESSAGQIYTKLQEIYVRAQRAANDINDPNARSALQQEINNFIDAIQKIGTDTEYNGMKILDGSFTGKYIHYGPRNDQVVYVSIGDLRAQSLGAHMINTIGYKASGTDTTALTGIFYDSSKTVTVEGKGITATYSAFSKYMLDVGKIAEDINANTTLQQKGISAKGVNVSYAQSAFTQFITTSLTLSGDVTVTFQVGDKSFNIQKRNDVTLDELISAINTAAATAGADLVASQDQGKLVLTSSKGYTIAVRVSATLSGTGNVVANLDQLIGDKPDLSDGSVTSVTKSVTAGSPTEVEIAYAAKVGDLYISRPESFNADLDSVDEGLGTFNIGNKNGSAFSNLKTIEVTDNLKAELAMIIVENAMRKVDTTRSQIGATMNNLQSIFDSQKTVYDNTKEAESVIRNTDYAKEMAEFTTYNIRMQATIAMLAQANTLPQLVLQLMR